MNRLIATIAISAAAIIGLSPLQTFAQQVKATTFTYDTSYLAQLYLAQLNKNGQPDTYIDKRIADERSRVRKLVDAEVTGLIAVSDQQDTQGGLNQTIARERSTLTAIQDEIRDRRVDLDLLNEEEKKFYLNPASDNAATNALKLTKSHQELLAKKAVLEERISAFQAGQTLEQDRLAKLSQEQLFAQFSTLFSVLSYVMIIVIAVVLDRLIRRRLIRRIEERSRRYMVAKLISVCIYVVAILWILSRLFTEHPGAVASLAIIGAGLAVALQDVVKDVVGWAIVLQRRLYRPGDRITLGIHTGDIIDIGLLRTTMLEVSTAGMFNAHEQTGKTLYFPNSMLLREPVLNYNTTSDFMNVEMKVTVTYESDWKRAEALVQTILRKETMPFVERARRQENRRTALFFGGGEPGEPGVNIDVATDGILFTLSFMVPIGSRRSVVTKISRDILDQFTAEKIAIAYSTVRVVGGRE